MEMGWFSRKPSRDLEALLIKHANGAVNIFGVALLQKKTNPPKGREDETVDLTVEKNRKEIRDELIKLIDKYGLKGKTDTQVPVHRNCSPPIGLALAVGCLRG
jgi:hypothetical protein